MSYHQLKSRNVHSQSKVHFITNYSFEFLDREGGKGTMLMITRVVRSLDISPRNFYEIFIIYKLMMRLIEPPSTIISFLCKKHWPWRGIHVNGWHAKITEQVNTGGGGGKVKSE
jgi:hypothetical protein